MKPIEIVDKHGRITDPAVLAAYERIQTRNERLVADRAAEAFLRLVQRYADKGIRLIPSERR